MKETIDAIRPLAVRIASGWWKGAADKYAPLTAEEKASLTAGAVLIVERAGRLSGPDPERLEWARRMAHVVRQSETTLRLGAFAPTAPRDEALAENTLWVLGRLKPGERAVYWAHNAHVQRAPVQGPPLPPGRFPGSGGHFAKALGKGYYAIATAYGGPSLDDQTAAPAGSVDGTLESVSKGSFLLPLTGGRRSAAVDAWLAEERMMRFQVGTLKLPLAAFDAVAFFDRASRVARE